MPTRSSSSSMPAAGIDDEVDAILTRLTDLPLPKTLALNKIDLVERPALARTRRRPQQSRWHFNETFMISALNGDGFGQMREKLAAMMKPGPWLYPEDQISDAPLRSLAAEITREKILERLHDELPYQITVETDQWKDMRRRLRANRADDLRCARKPQKNCHRRKRPDAEIDRHGGAQSDRRSGRDPGSSLPVCQSARKLGRRSRALPGNGPRISARLRFRRIARIGDCDREKLLDRTRPWNGVTRQSSSECVGTARRRPSSN